MRHIEDVTDRVSVSVLTGSQDSYTVFTNSGNSCCSKLNENAVVHTRVGGNCQVPHCARGCCKWRCCVWLEHQGQGINPVGSPLRYRCGFGSHNFREEVFWSQRVTARARSTTSAGRTASLPRLRRHRRLHHPVIERCLQAHLWQRTVTSSRALSCARLAWCSGQHLRRPRTILWVDHPG